MATIQCLNCGHINAALLVTCDNCYQALKTPEDAQPTPDHAEGLQQENPVLRGIADFVFYSFNYPGSPQINLTGFLDDVKNFKPELPALHLSERFANAKLPTFDLTPPAINAPEFPDIDFSIILSYFANLQAPQVDFSRALEFLNTLQLPQIDLNALGELLPHIDLSTANLPALAELLPHLDLSTIDLPLLGDLLSNIDLSAVDLTALADLLAGIDWSALAEGLSDIDFSALLELLEGIDLS